MNVHPFLFCRSRCEEAAHFYATALGGVWLNASSRFLCYSGEDPNEGLYSEIFVGGKLLVQMSDCAQESTYPGCSVSLEVLTVEQAKAYFNALAEGIIITLPFAPSFFKSWIWDAGRHVRRVLGVNVIPREGTCALSD